MQLDSIFDIHNVISKPDFWLFHKSKETLSLDQLKCNQAGCNLIDKCIAKPQGDYTTEFIEFLNLTGCNEQTTQDDTYINYNFKRSCKCKYTPLHILAARHFNNSTVDWCWANLPNSQLLPFSSTECHDSHLGVVLPHVESLLTIFKHTGYPPEQIDRRWFFDRLDYTTLKLLISTGYFSQIVDFVGYRAVNPKIDYRAISLDAIMITDKAPYTLYDVVRLWLAGRVREHPSDIACSPVLLYSQPKPEAKISLEEENQSNIMRDALLTRGYFDRYADYMLTNWLANPEIFQGFKDAVLRTDYDCGRLFITKLPMHKDFSIHDDFGLKIPITLGLAMEIQLSPLRERKNTLADIHYFLLQHSKPWSVTNASTRVAYSDFNEIRLNLLMMVKRGFLHRDVVNGILLPMIYQDCYMIFAVQFIEIPSSSKIKVNKYSLSQLQEKALKYELKVVDWLKPKAVANAICLSKISDQCNMDDQEILDAYSKLLLLKYKENKLLVYAAYNRLAPADDIPMHAAETALLIAKHFISREKITISLKGITHRLTRKEKRERQLEEQAERASKVSKVKDWYWDYSPDSDSDS